VSGFDGKVPGRASGVTAADLAASNEPARVPGRKNLVDTYTMGVAYVDDDARCAGKADATPGCFLSDSQRARLIMLLVHEVSTAQTNYKFAIEELRVDHLIEKDDDLQWVIGLVLDVATAHVSAVASKALNRLKNNAIDRVDQIGLQAGMHGEFDESSSTERLASSLRALNDKSVETAAKSGFDIAKKQATKAAKSVQNAATKDEKTETISYLDQLKDRCDIGYEHFLRDVLANASDAELVVIFNGLDPQYHRVDQYKEALAAKVARFKKSGVTTIGQRAIVPAQSHAAMVFANKRCVWLRDAHGGKSLWFYSVVSGNQTAPWTNGRLPDVERVPDEFVAAALVKSEEKWGATPTLDNPGVAVMRNMGMRVDANSASPAFSTASAEPAATLPRLQLGDIPPPQVCSADEGKNTP
jgi:hypothetical protein